MRTRDLVMERLGGPFDYTSFDEELKDLMVEKDQVLRDFEKEKLNPPIPMNFQHKAHFDFSINPLPEF
jgi:hypothetical protein